MGSDRRARASVVEEAGSGGMGMDESGYGFDGVRTLSDPSHGVWSAEVLRSHSTSSRMCEINAEARALCWKVKVLSSRVVKCLWCRTAERTRKLDKNA